MTKKTTTNSGKNKKKSVEKCEKTLSKPLKPFVFSVHYFICFLLNVHSMPMGTENNQISKKDTGNNRIMRKDFKKIYNYEKSNQKFKKIMKIRGIQVIKKIVRR